MCDGLTKRTIFGGESKLSEANGTRIYASQATSRFNLMMQNSLKRLTANAEQVLGDNLVALLLGGGYGRGEGGALMRDCEEFPYDVLELFPILKSKNKKTMNALAEIARKFKDEFGIKAEFVALLTVKETHNLPNSLIWQDLLNGHITLTGPKDLLAKNISVSLKEPLPHIEAMRLLFNSGTQLLQALRAAKGLEDSPERDFVKRSYYGCLLALGDGLLIIHRRYAVRYEERYERFQELAAAQADVALFKLNELYCDALKFKLSPSSALFPVILPVQLNSLANLWLKIFLYSESRRTGRIWNAPDEYSAFKGSLESDYRNPLKLLSNIVRNLEQGRASFRNPKERLHRQLPLLLSARSEENFRWASESAQFLEEWRKINR